VKTCDAMFPLKVISMEEKKQTEVVTFPFEDYFYRNYVSKKIKNFLLYSKKIRNFGYFISVKKKKKNICTYVLLI